MTPSDISRHDFADDLDAIARIDAVPRILEVVCRTTGLRFAAVARVTDRRWVACAVRDEMGFGLVAGGELKLETTLCNEIRQHRHLIVIDDVADDEAFKTHPVPQRYGFRGYISVPITLENGAFFGTLCAIDPHPRTLNTPETIGMFTLFADLIAFHLAAADRVDELERRVALRTLELDRANTDLHDRIVASETDRQALQALTERLERVREDERTRIARELHDELGQTLTALKLDVEAVRAGLDRPPTASARDTLRTTVDTVTTTLDGSLDALERIVSELRPAVLDSLGIAAAADWLLTGFSHRTGIRCTCDCDDDEGVAPAVATALFRILQEALTNVTRHAAATEVQVSVRRDGAAVALTVADNGRGLGGDRSTERTGHGLRGMAERMRALGGALVIGPGIDGGTTLTASCPAGMERTT